MKNKLFKGKRVLIFGLGLLGGGIEAAKWFYKNGAKLIITDKKTKKELLPSIKRLKKIKAKYILGEHRFEDIDSSDIVYFNPGVSNKSEWANYAKEKEKEVVNDCYLFFKYAKGDVIAITGTRGKTTTTTWIYELLTQVSNIYPNNRPNRLPESSDRIEFTRITRPNNIPEYQSNKNQRLGPNSGNPFGPHSGSDLKFGQHSGNIFGQNSGRNILLGGNQPERSLFKILDKTKENTVSVLELSSFQLEFYPTADEDGFNTDKHGFIKAPKIAIITNIYNDHLNRYSGFEEYASVKARIFQNQTKEDFLILNLDNDWTKFFLKLKPKSQVYFVSLNKKLPKGIYIKNDKVFIKDEKEYQIFSIKKFKEIYGKHNLYNLLFALLTLYLYLKSKNVKNPQNKIKKLKNFIFSLKTPKFRQEIIYQDKNLMIVNDSAATSPDATINAIERFKKYKDLILITGGTDKNLDFKELAKKIKKEIKPENLILLNGSATKKLIEELRKLKYPLIEENIFEDLREAIHRGLMRISELINADSKRIKNDKNDPYISVQNPNESMGENDPYRSVLNLYTSVILFSPASASFEKFKNEFDRGEKFNKIVRKLVR
jgi:UDP-N-acetylmuramoylalanine--D-glutamate ligase